MRFYVIAPDGNKYGPADLPTLNRWAEQGRLLPDTYIEEEATHHRYRAIHLPGLAFPGGPSDDGRRFHWVPEKVDLAKPFAGNREITISKVFSAIGLVALWYIGPLLGLVFARRARTLGSVSTSSATNFAWLVLAVNLVGTCWLGPVAYQVYASERRAASKAEEAEAPTPGVEVGSPAPAAGAAKANPKAPAKGN